jgi:phenylacetate-CoA ligase
MDPHYDALEGRDPAERERILLQERLPRQVALAKARSARYGELLAGIDPGEVASRAALARLPVTRKSDLPALQKAMKPFGGLNATPPSGLARIFVSPGPIYDPEGRGADYWGTARTLFAAGFRPGDVVLNCFSYHLTPAGSMFETGLHHLDCAVIPGGVGQTELQAGAIADLRPAGYVGTPSFLKLIVEKCDELGLDSSSVKRALVSGEALLPPVREFLAARGIACFQAYGTADLGMVAYESQAHDGLIVNEHLIVEIVRPGTGDPVPEGEVGEVLVTPFNPDYPLLRFATGDLSATMPGRSACGRTGARIRGWMGRADQSTKVRGLFVHPHQVAEVLRRHGIARGRLVVENDDGEDRMTLTVERLPEDPAPLEASIREVMKVRGALAEGALPNDGKVIEDRRRYS